MLSLIIVISIVLVAARALATRYYGGSAFRKGAANSEAARLLKQSQQLQGAAELYRADTGAYRLAPRLLLRHFNLSKVTFACLAATSALVTQAQTYQFRVPVSALQVAPALIAAPAFSLSTGALDFGSVTVAATKDLSLIVSNTGNVPLDTPRVSITGTGFSSVHNCAASLAVGGTCTVTGTFAPPAAGSYSSILSIGYPGLSSQTAALSGAGAGGADSCAAILANNPGATSGVYTLAPSVGMPFQAYCDMTSDGGGWTRIVRQTEQEPVTNWDGGVNGASYALATAQIPAHSQVGFGKDEQATFIDYVTWRYTTGNISPTVVLTSPKTGKATYIYRSDSNFHYMYTPRTASLAGSCSGWCQTLEVQQADEVAAWAFAPLTDATHRGFALSGTPYYNSTETFAWTVWVR